MAALLAWASAARAQPAPASLPPPVQRACISSPFGQRRLPGPHAAAFHNGIDLPAAAGTWVTAVAPGTITDIRRLGSSGLEVDVRHDGYLTRYAHLGSVAPPVADGRWAVAAGTRLGRVGRTGITHGTHLHFELHVAGKPVDPEPFFSVARCRQAGPAD